MAGVGYRLAEDMAAGMAGVEWEYEMLEGPINTDLLRRDSGGTDWRCYERGVLFGPLCEVRVRRRGTLWHLVMVADVEEAPEGWHGWQGLKREGDGSVVLWGEANEACKLWLEGRIPRALAYPFAARGRSRVRCQVFRYRMADGTPLERYVRLETEEISNAATAR